VIGHRGGDINRAGATCRIAEKWNDSHCSERSNS
jgi:hypothetical protein